MGSARGDTRQNLSARSIRNVLIVCYGNIWRSPFAAALLRQVGPHGIEVRSGGFHQNAGRACPPRHVQMSRRLGIELEAHRSTVLDSADVAWADIIVLMDRHNWQALRHAGASTGQLVWLGALDGGSLEIPDPYDMDDAAAHDVVLRLQSCIMRLAALLVVSDPAATSG